MNQITQQLTNPKAYKLFATGLFSFLLSYVAASTFAPVANSSATDIPDTKTQNFSVTVANPYYINITSSHASASEPISLDYGADGNIIGNVIATSDTVTTETNSPLTHYLYLSTTSNSNSLSSSDEHNTDTISAGGGDNLAGATTLSDNTWGFALPSGTSGLPSNATFDADYSSVSNASKFTKVPTSGNEVLIQQETGSGNRRDMAVTTSTADVYYGTKVTTDLPAGTYSNVVRYTAYAEEPDTTTKMIDDLEYMQDITTEICNNSYTGMTARLKDKRGRGNGGTAADASYGVIKAKDGNCWMTENFDLYNKTVSYTESDFTSGTFAIPDTSNWEAKSGPEEVKNAKAHVVTASTPSNYSGDKSPYYGQVYYNFSSAIAVANSQSATTDQDHSVCPKGWTLPKNGEADTDKTYLKLLSYYGVTRGNEIVNATDDADVRELGFNLFYGYWSMLNSEAQEIHQSLGGLFWTSTAVDASYAQDFYYLRSSFNRNRIYKGYGLSIRCVAR